jgi:hypothetical protein
MDHNSYSENTEVDSAPNNKFEPMSSNLGEPQMHAPGSQYLMPPHTGFTDGAHHAGSHPGLQTGSSAFQVPDQLQNLYDTYVASYDDEHTPNSTRMGHAKCLALALLQHYYPKNEGYFIRPSHLGPVAKHGLNFMTRGQDGRDPVFKALLPLKKAKVKISKTEIVKRETKRQYKHNSAFYLTVEWHFIEPEDITGFEVLKKTTVLNGDIKEEQYLPYTYLAIMIDDLKNFSFAEVNDVHRGDLLTDVLCHGQHIRTGYGVLVFGTRLEFYDFDNGEDSRASTNPATNSSISVNEPYVTLSKNVDGEDLVVDMRKMKLELVDAMFKEVVAKKVEYVNEIVEEDGDDMAGEEDADGELEEGEVTMSDVAFGN